MAQEQQAQDFASLRLGLLRRYGPGIFSPPEAAAPLPTGYPALDAALGSGGLPRGRIVELSGDDSGKLSLALGVLAGATRAGGLAALIDPARGFYPPSAAAAGVHLPNLAVVQPDGPGRALDAMATLLQTEGFDAVVYDLPRGGKAPNAGQLARLAAGAAHTGTLVLVLDPAIGGYAHAARPAHRPLGYFASVRLLVERRTCHWRRGPDGRPLELAGYRLAVTILKHKLAPAGTSVEIEVAPGEGRTHGGAQDRLLMDPARPGLADAASAAGVGEPTADRRRHAG